MKTLIRREFTVNVPLEIAWEHLAQVEQWPSWAEHINSVELAPSGELTPESTGTIHLNSGLTSTFEMTEFNPHRNWKWAGPFLWLTVHYDHRFETINDHTSKLIFVVAGEGFGATTLGRLFAAIYNHNLNKAIPNLITEMNEISQ